ncbi:hypothetical protein [Capybara microvirus Cap1_SP_142]|nr:hypothetical protein [Capybara microvirus Cap1_SP_142]
MKTQYFKINMLLAMSINRGIKAKRLCRESYLYRVFVSMENPRCPSVPLAGTLSTRACPYACAKLKKTRAETSNASIL